MSYVMCDVCGLYGDADYLVGHVVKCEADRDARNAKNTILNFVEESIVFWEGYILTKLDKIDEILMQDMDEIPSTSMLRVLENYAHSALEGSKHLDGLRDRAAQLERELES